MSKTPKTTQEELDHILVSLDSNPAIKKQVKANIEKLIQTSNKEARISGIEEAHKEIMEMAYAYTGEDELADFYYVCGQNEQRRLIAEALKAIKEKAGIE